MVARPARGEPAEEALEAEVQGAGRDGALKRGPGRALAGCLILLAGACGCGPRAGGRANVVFILVDALRADHVGAYGYAKGTTPNIDALASSALLYENAYSTATWTVPSSASLFTSTLPVVHRINSPPSQQFAFSVLSERFVLPNEVFKEDGYATGMITTIGWVSPTANYDQGADEFVRSDQGDEGLVRLARRFITKHREERFHLYLHLIGLHEYYDPPRIFAEGGKEKIGPSSRLLALEGVTRGQAYSLLAGDLSEPGTLTPADVEALIASYDRDLRRTDALIGEVAGHLGAEGLLDDTLVVVTADHGEQFLEHGLLMHAGYGFYNEVLRIPFIVSGRGRFGGQTRIATPISTIDFYPTLFDLLGIEKPDLFQGERVQPGGDDGRAVFATDGRIWKVVTSRWSHILSAERNELYDLAADPGEGRNLARLPEHAGTLEEMGRRLQEMKGRSLEHEYLAMVETPGEAEMTDEERDALRALGYIQ